MCSPRGSFAPAAVPERLTARLMRCSRVWLSEHSLLSVPRRFVPFEFLQTEATCNTQELLSCLLLPQGTRHFIASRLP